MKTISVYEFYLACKAGFPKQGPRTKVPSATSISQGTIILFFLFFFYCNISLVKPVKKQLQIKPCTVFREHLVYMTTYPYLMISSINNKPSLATVLD